MRGHLGPELSVFGSIVGEAKASIGYNLGQGVGFCIGQDLVCVSKPDGKQPRNTWDHPARITPDSPALGNTHIRLCLPEAQAHFDMRCTA